MGLYRNPLRHYRFLFDVIDFICDFIELHYDFLGVLCDFIVFLANFLDFLCDFVEFLGDFLSSITLKPSQEFDRLDVGMSSFR